MNEQFTNINVMKTLIQKFNLGDALTDAEVLELYSFFLRLETDLFALGDPFWLARTQITRNLMSIDGYKNARGL